MTKERRTAALAVVMLAGFGALSVWRGHPTRAEFLFSSAVVLGVTALVSSGFAGGFHRAWMRVAYVAGAGNTLVILALVYLVGFVGCRMWGRLTGRDSLARRAPPQPSYWIPKARTHPSPWQFERRY